MNLSEIFKKYRRLIRLGMPLIIPLFIYLFIYYPLHKKITRLAKEHKKYINSMQDLGIFTLSPKSTTDFVRKNLQMETGFFASDSESINSISRLCYRLGLDLISITPVKEEKVTDKD
ncbi:MAG: hypothetical protein ACK4NT_01230, partial [Candidatus Omnitrophota bacterium]